MFPVMVYKNKSAVAPRPASGIRHSRTGGGLPHWNYNKFVQFRHYRKRAVVSRPASGLDIAALAADYPTGINTYLFNFYYHLQQQNKQ